MNLALQREMFMRLPVRLYRHPPLPSSDWSMQSLFETGLDHSSYAGDLARTMG
jgi:hypothetical protein